MRNAQLILHLMLLTLPAWALETPCPRDANEAMESFGDRSSPSRYEAHFRRKDGGVLSIHQSTKPRDHKQSFHLLIQWDDVVLSPRHGGPSMIDPEDILHAHLPELPQLASLRSIIERKVFEWTDSRGSGAAQSSEDGFIWFDQQWKNGRVWRCTDTECACSDPDKERTS